MGAATAGECGCTGSGGGAFAKPRDLPSSSSRHTGGLAALAIAKTW
jgi:hypothetical protein